MFLLCEGNFKLSNPVEEVKIKEASFTHGLFAHGALVGVTGRLVVVGVGDESCTHPEQGEGFYF